MINYRYLLVVDVVYKSSNIKVVLSLNPILNLISSGSIIFVAAGIRTSNLNIFGY